MPVGAYYLDDVRDQFRRIKDQAERALAQVDDADLDRTLDPGSNSLAILVQHMSGNLRSRFTGFLTSDGEKPDRDRDSEFEAAGAAREALMARWDEGWSVLFRTLDALTPDDLLKEVTIRGQRHSVVQALQRALTHQAGHGAQIVFLAKHLRGSDWQTLTLPRRPSRR